MRYLLFNWDDILEDLSDPSDLTDEQFENLCKKYNGLIYDNEDDFQSDFNAEMFSVHTHQLRIIQNSKQ